MRQGIVINALGIGVGQGIMLAATPFLARVYTPAQFGEYATLVAAAGVIATVAALRLDVALPAVDSSDVLPLLHAALLFAFLSSVVAGSLLTFLPHEVAAYSQFTNVSLLNLVVTGALMGATNVCQGWFTRGGYFGTMAAVKILQPAVFALLALFMISGLIGAVSLSWASVLVFSVWTFRESLSSLSFRRSWSALKRAMQYPLLSTPLALLDTLSLALPLFFIASEFGSNNAGNYSQVQRLLAAPMMLIGIAVAQVFFKHAGDLYRSGGNVEPLLWRIVLTLSGGSALLLIGTYLVGQPLMTMLLGPGWRTDTSFLLLAVLPMIVRMIVSPVSSIFLITNRLAFGGVWQGAYFVVTASVIWYARGRLSFEGYLVALGCAELMMYLLYLACAISVVRDDRRGHGPLIR